LGLSLWGYGLLERMVYKRKGSLKWMSKAGLGKHYSDTNHSITSHDMNLEPTKQNSFNMEKEILQLQCNSHLNKPNFQNGILKKKSRKISNTKQ